MFDKKEGEIHLKLRKYRPTDCPELVRLFHDTVHSVCARDYTPEQLDAWADGCPDLEAWDRSLRTHDTLVAEEGGQILGFGDMTADGYLDRLFVHREAQGRGIASALCAALERRCSAPEFTVHASRTALAFFQDRGYRVVREQQVERRGVLLANFVMIRPAVEGVKKNKRSFNRGEK